MNDRPKRSSTRPSLPAPPPPSSDPKAQRRDLIQTAPDLPVPRSRPSPPPHGQPAHGQIQPEVSVDPVVARRDAKTVPGGGLNRISDGRAAAAAYVGVKPLAEGARPLPSTLSPVKLARDLQIENKEFRTEPALRASIPPPSIPSRQTPVSPHRALGFRPGSPQAVMTVVALLAVAVGVLTVVATSGVRLFPTERIVSVGQAEVQWDHGIDGQPGVLAPPLGPAAPADAAPKDLAAGQPADGGPSARSADPAPTSTSAVLAATGTNNSGNDLAERSKVDPEPASGLASPAAPRRPTKTSSSAPEPERTPPQPWLE
jgi:hypothetical protein